uniref:Insulin like growth factor binding protein 7 n=1 Tax=Athene cunicularia TaxID=194338 RepID=A0A663LKR2_ATHCN
MHLKSAPHGCRAECTCKAEVSACSEPQKEHQDPNLLLFYGARNEPCSVSQHTWGLQPGWLWSTCSHRKCLLLVEPNGSFSFLLLPASSEQKWKRPSIVTPPKDIWNVTGAQIYLSCEVMGIPTPVLIWNKIIRGQYGVQRMELLPGDRENLAIQTRGGPEKHEVTGWVLISPLSKEDAGEYECHASNAKGEATASAKIHVVETLHEIALTKGR